MPSGLSSIFFYKLKTGTANVKEARPKDHSTVEKKLICEMLTEGTALAVAIEPACL